MSKYQKLRNNDTTTVPTDDDEQHFVIFNNDDHNLYPNRHYDDDRGDDYHSNDRILYNDTINDDQNKYNANSNRINHSTGKDSIMNGGNINGSNSLRCTSGSSSNLLITTLDADESTMEIPLLQHNYRSNNNNNYNDNYDDKKNKVNTRILYFHFDSILLFTCYSNSTTNKREW